MTREQANGALRGGSLLSPDLIIVDLVILLVNFDRSVAIRIVELLEAIADGQLL